MLGLVGERFPFSVVGTSLVLHEGGRGLYPTGTGDTGREPRWGIQLQGRWFEQSQKDVTLQVFSGPLVH